MRRSTIIFLSLSRPFRAGGESNAAGPGVHAECFEKTAVSGRGDAHGAGVAQALDPAECRATAQQRRADRATEMRAALGPIQAGAAERPFAGSRRDEIDTEPG